MPTNLPCRIVTVAALIVGLVACAERTTTLPPADSPVPLPRQRRVGNACRMLR